MKTKTNKLISLAVVLALLLSLFSGVTLSGAAKTAFAEDDVAGDVLFNILIDIIDENGAILLDDGAELEYSTDTNGVIITKATLPSDYSNGILYIPSEINGIEVYCIGEGSFYGTSFAGEICMPNTITVIETTAFKNAKEISKIVLSENLISIEDQAFKLCESAYMDASIIKSLDSLGAGVFYRCFNLVGEIEIPTDWTIIYEDAFVLCSSLTGDLIIPDNIMQIDVRAFGTCTGMTGKLVLSENLTAIADSAFGGSSFTGDLFIPNKVETIGASSFNKISFDKIVFPENLKSVCDNSFISSVDIVDFTKVLDIDQIKVVNKVNYNRIFLTAKQMYISKDISFGITCDNLMVTNGGKIDDKYNFVAEALATPTKEGYTFAGWYANADFTGEAVTTPVANTTYYAKWTYDVEFVTNGGEAIADETYTEGVAGVLPNPTKEGYLFNGWYSDETLETKIEKTTDIDEEGILYAKWSPNEYTIAFDASSGTGSMADLDATYDESQYLTSNLFTNAETTKIFAGWDTDSSADEVVYSDGASVKNLIAEDGETVTLYAVWSDKEAQVSANLTTIETYDYDGTAKSYTAQDGYTITYYLGAEEVASPIGAGSYDVALSKVGDDTCIDYFEVFEDLLVIEKIAPDYEVPTGLYAYSGDTLADVSLTDGFAFEDDNTTLVGEAGTKTFAVTYTPNDTDNYRVINDIDVTIEVLKITSADSNLVDAVLSDIDSADKEEMIKILANAITATPTVGVSTATMTDKVVQVESDGVTSILVSAEVLDSALEAIANDKDVSEYSGYSVVDGEEYTIKVLGTLDGENKAIVRIKYDGNFQDSYVVAHLNNDNEVEYISADYVEIESVGYIQFEISSCSPFVIMSSIASSSSSNVKLDGKYTVGGSSSSDVEEPAETPAPEVPAETQKPVEPTVTPSPTVAPTPTLAPAPAQSGSGALVWIILGVLVVGGVAGYVIYKKKQK